MALPVRPRPAGAPNRRAHLRGAAAFAATLGTALAVLGASEVGDRVRPRRSLGAFDEPERVERKLKYVNFGTSDSWGAKLEDRRRAYPFLLSPDVTNLALRATGPLYPSLCAASMLGDEVADVVTIEFFGIDPPSTHRLALRLRRRFPDAIMIFLVHFYPMMIQYKRGDDGSVMNLLDWAKRNAPGIDTGNPEFAVKMERDGEGTFRFKPMKEELEAFQSTIDAVGGYVVRLVNFTDPIETIRQAGDFTQDDFHHPSPKGHHHYAQHIRSIVDEASKTYPLHPRVQRWEHEDNCQTWFESGIHEQSSQGMTMDEFRQGKHALNVDEESGGSLSVTNPSDRPMKLWISFMATGPPPSIYPKTRVSIKGDDSDGVIIDPVTVGWLGDRRVHVSEHKPIGLVQPGTSVVSFTQLERTQKPFRVIGTLVTPDT